MTEPEYEQPRTQSSEGSRSSGVEEGRTEAVCTACGHAGLEPGFVEDSGQGSQGYTRWIAGALERGIFGGAYKMGKQRWVVEAWRCTSCFHLEHYARSTT